MKMIAPNIAIPIAKPIPLETLKTLERKGLLRGPFMYSYSRLKLRFARGRSDSPNSVVLQNGATLPRIGRWKRS